MLKVTRGSADLNAPTLRFMFPQMLVSLRLEREYHLDYLKSSPYRGAIPPLS